MSTAAPVAHAAPSQPDVTRPVVGLLAEYDSPGALISAAERVRDAGFTRWDTHSPFPVHGIDAAMGIRPTRLPFIVFACGFLGCMLGLGLQIWANATDASRFPQAPNFVSGYNFHVSGKPELSLPAFIPVTFELTVLLAAFAAVFGMLALNSLPWHANALFAVERFRRATSDRFFVFIDARDPKFSLDRAGSLLTSAGAAAIERVYELGSAARLPKGFRVAGMVLLCLALIPPLWIAKARSSLSEKPRIHIIQDMDNQEKFKAQKAAALFADGRASRPQVPGTVARSDPPRNDFLYKGVMDGQWATEFPPAVRITEELVRRGQQRFNIYCAPCHGLGGAGDGIVHERALRLGTENWVQPTNLLDEVVRGRENGHIFNTITNGIRSMPPYGDQIPPADRWAIVAYVRALQFSQNAPVELVPAELRPTKDGRPGQP